MKKSANKRTFLALIPFAVFILLVIGLVGALRHSDAAKTKFATHLNEAVPVTELVLLGSSGAKFSTEEWRGHVYVLNFFASWCVECHAEHDQLLRLGRQNVPLIGVAFKDHPVDAMAYLTKHGNPFLAVARDEDGRAGIDWGLTGVPETFLIDADGIIRFHYAGPLTEKIVDEKLLPLWRRLQK